MNGEPLYFADAWETYETIRTLFEVLEEKVAARDAEDIESTLITLIHAYEGMAELIRARRGVRGRTLGAVIPHESWRDMGPNEILGELQLFVTAEEIGVAEMRAKLPEARTATRKKLSQQIAKTQRELVASVRLAKHFIQKNWPEVWSPELERMFRGYL